jgi:hypothetical protein
MSTSIPTNQAWRTFGDWKTSGREIGVIFYGCSGNSLYTMGFVESARNGKLLLKSDTARVSFNLVRRFSLTKARSLRRVSSISVRPKHPPRPIKELDAADGV